MRYAAGFRPWVMRTCLPVAAYVTCPMPGLFTVWRGQPGLQEKPSEACVGFSRDDFPWTWPDRRTFYPISETPGAWNDANVQSVAGGRLVMGVQLYFYVSARGDGTLVPVRWSGASDLSAVAGKKVRLRFHLTNGRFCAFWVSPDESGASQGYVVAGGLGFTSNRDTIGRRSANH